jgi:hypothetical protein
LLAQFNSVESHSIQQYLIRTQHNGAISEQCDQHNSLSPSQNSCAETKNRSRRTTLKIVEFTRFSIIQFKRKLISKMNHLHKSENLDPNKLPKLFRINELDSLFQSKILELWNLFI